MQNIVFRTFHVAPSCLNASIDNLVIKVSPWKRAVAEKTDKSDTKFSGARARTGIKKKSEFKKKPISNQISNPKRNIVLRIFPSLLFSFPRFSPYPSTLFPAFLAVCFARAIARVKSRQPILPLIVEFPAFFFTVASRWGISRGEAKMTAKITLVLFTA